MENKLFVGNLAWAVTEQDLEGLFGQAGTVQEVAVMRDRFSGRARGFAFVTMGSSEEANKAVSLFEEKEFMGRPLKVNVARPREDNGGGGFGGGDRPRRSGGFGGGGDRPRGGGRSFGGGGGRGFGGGADRGGHRGDRGSY